MIVFVEFCLLILFIFLLARGKSFDWSSHLTQWGLFRCIYCLVKKKKSEYFVNFLSEHIETINRDNISLSYKIGES